MRRFLEREPFDAIINCAALLVKTSGERKCEAVKLNSWLPHFLDGYCEKRDAYLIQASTDGVFSGRRGWYQEDDICDAGTFYGKSKYLGEVCGSHALTVRSGFWGMDINPNGAGLLQWFMRQDGSVSGYAGALFNGVSNLEFAKFAGAAIQNHWTGVCHLCAAEAISKFDFLCLAKSAFSRETNIVRSEAVQINRTLRCTRTDIPYRQKTFERMLKEQRDLRLTQEKFLSSQGK